MERRKIFDAREATALRKMLEDRLHPEQKGEVERLVEWIEQHRCGVIKAFEKKGRTAFQIRHFDIRWATVRGKKYFDVVWHTWSFPLPWPSDFELIVPGTPKWRNINSVVYEEVAPEIMERRINLMFRRLIRRCGFYLRLREGKDRWGEALDPNNLKMTDYDLHLRAIVARMGDLSYLITRVGTFLAGYRNTRIQEALKYVFGLTGRHVRNGDSLEREIERQLELREEAGKIFSFVPRGRITEVDPRYGMIKDGVFFPVDRYSPKIKLPEWIRSIRQFLFALYGREVPEKPNFYLDYSVPPWALRRFGKPVRAFLLDEDPERDLFVFVRDDKLYLGFGEKTFDVTGWVKKPDVASAFRAAFGVDLPPQATREDIEAIIGLRAIGS